MLFDNKNYTYDGFASNILGFTMGIEYDPFPNSFIRLEYRELNTSGERLFIAHNKSHFSRNELMLNLGLIFNNAN